MIRLKVSAQRIFVVQADTLTSGTVGEKCEFIFSKDWQGLERTAIFEGAGEARAVLLGSTGTEAVIPWECLETADVPLNVSVYGSNGTTRVIPTICADVCMIELGADPEVTPGATPSPSIVAQLQAAAETATAKAEAAEADADRAEAARIAAEAAQEAAETAQDAAETAQSAAETAAATATADAATVAADKATVTEKTAKSLEYALRTSTYAETAKGYKEEAYEFAGQAYASAGNAAASAAEISGLTANATTTGAAQASVTVSGGSGTPIHLAFQIPKGNKGDTGDSGVYIGTEAPTNGATVWIDTSGDADTYDAENTEF